MSETKVPFADKAKAKVIFEWGSWICRKVRPVGKWLFGDQPIPQWYLTDSSAHDLEQLGVKIAGDPTASGVRRTGWTQGLYLEGHFPATHHALYGTSEVVDRKPAVCFTVGKAVVAALIPKEERAAILGIGGGDLQAAVGMFNAETRGLQFEELASYTVAPVADLQMLHPQAARM